MKKFSSLLFITLGLFFYLSSSEFVFADGFSQQPTVALPTVTGTPRGVTATVNLNSDDAINVRSGPNSLADLVGQLLPGQTVPVLGRTVGGDWLKIQYFGGPNNEAWVYEPLVDLSPGEIPIAEMPPTLTPDLSQTVDPTLAAQFITTPNPTRMATFTPVTPLVVATYQDIAQNSFIGGIPMGLIILVLGGMGGLLAIFSYIKAR